MKSTILYGRERVADTPHIYLNGLRWEICFVFKEDDNLNQLKKEENYIAYGLTNAFEQKIYINRDLNEVQMKRTLMHELTHAFLFSYGFDDHVFNEEELCQFVGQNTMYLVQVVNGILDIH